MNFLHTTLSLFPAEGIDDNPPPPVIMNGKTGASTTPINREKQFMAVPLSDAGPGGNMPMSPADLHGMWYPTVRRTLVCLSKLYRCIDRATFQVISP